MWPFSGGHILEKGPPRSAKNVLQALYLMTKFNVTRQLWISWKSGFWDYRNGGNPTRASNLSIL